MNRGRACRLDPCFGRPDRRSFSVTADGPTPCLPRDCLRAANCRKENRIFILAPRPARPYTMRRNGIATVARTPHFLLAVLLIPRPIPNDRRRAAVPVRATPHTTGPSPVGDRTAPAQSP